ncbi:MAG: hypothetical protein AAB892_00020 [Patescibacteria group bacterium]
MNEEKAAAMVLGAGAALICLAASALYEGGKALARAFHLATKASSEELKRASTKSS